MLIDGLQLAHADDADLLAQGIVMQARGGASCGCAFWPRLGETHEDVGLFSFDSGRKRIVLRQFGRSLSGRPLG